MPVMGPGGAIDQAARGVGGAGRRAGAFLTGANPFRRYHADVYDPDPNAFKDPTAEANKQAYADAIANASGRAAPTVGDSSFRQGQADLVAQLQARASGQGPSIVQDTLKQATDRNVAQAAALGSSALARGVSPALAAQNVQRTQADLAQGMAADAALLRNQEQIDATNQLGAVLGQGRGMDIQAGTANAQLSLANQAQIDDLVRFYTSAGLSIDQAQFAAQQALEQLRMQGSIAGENINAQTSMNQQNNATGLFGDVVGGVGAAGGQVAGALIGASDVRVKDDIAPADDEVQAFLDSMAAKGWVYNDPGAPGQVPGRQVGVMAQDMERSPLGAQVVKDTPNGKMIDGPGAVRALLAAAANLNERLKDLEPPGSGRYESGTIGVDALLGRAREIEDSLGPAPVREDDSGTETPMGPGEWVMVSQNGSDEWSWNPGAQSPKPEDEEEGYLRAIYRKYLAPRSAAAEGR